MRRFLVKTHARRLFGIAFLCAVALTILVPSVASAHSILLKANPAPNAVVHASPTRVQMWFSEDLDPSLSTAQVVNANRKRVDANDAHINSADNKQIDLSLPANLPPGIYTVVWRSDAADDGHVLLGSFIFTIANADGTVPHLPAGANPARGILGSIGTSVPGTLDGPTVFNLIMVILVELGAIFWMGGQLWVNFVLQSSAEKHPEEQGLNTRMGQRFERGFSLPTLVILLLANIGVLYGQVLTLTGNNWGAALSLNLLSKQATIGGFGTYWLLRMAVTLLALIVGLYMVLSKQRPRLVNQALPLINLFLGAMLFLAVTLSGHAVAVNALFLPFSVVIDWLHLLAAALWIGGLFYILLIYLPVLKQYTLSERVRSLLVILPAFSPLAIGGIALMAITGPLNATFHLSSPDQFVATAYGRALLVKVLLVAVLLVVSAWHVGLLRPRLKREYQKYTYAHERLEKIQARVNKDAVETEVQASGEQSKSVKQLAQQVKLREERLEKKTALMTRILRWEPWFGVAIIVCVGLMNVFGNTLTQPAAAQQPQQQSVTHAFTGTAKTSDGKYSVTLNVNPNQFGLNTFTVTAKDLSTGEQLGANQANVTIFTTMLDMDMGTQSVDLQFNGKGSFSGSGELSMGGNWQIQVLLRTPDGKLHTANFDISTPI